MLRGDLHTHTVASDGALSTPALCQLAREEGLAVVAITDHDTVAGWPALGRTWPEVVGGVQLTTTWQDQTLDLLGYYQELPEITNLLLLDLKAARQKRVEAMVRLLKEAGADISDALPPAVALADLGRPHLAQALVRAGHAASVLDAFDRYLDKGRPGYVARAELIPRDVIEAVHADRGLAVLAWRPEPIVEPLISLLLEWGLDGVEAYHPRATPQETLSLLDFADRHGLVVTAGSDFHRPEDGRLGVPSLAEERLLVFLAALARRQMMAPTRDRLGAPGAEPEES